MVASANTLARSQVGGVGAINVGELNLAEEGALVPHGGGDGVAQGFLGEEHAVGIWLGRTRGDVRVAWSRIGRVAAAAAHKNGDGCHHSRVFKSHTFPMLLYK